MKIGVAYNLFDGVELLEKSINCIRNHVDYICVIYQQISNWGNSANPEDVKELKRLHLEGKINDVFLYTPFHAGGHLNEIHKRQIGMDKCIENGCDIHISMDCDEFYMSEQFLKAIHKFIGGDYDSSACQMRSYYGGFNYQITPPEEYYVSLFYKVSKGDQFYINAPFKVLVDPTRRILNKSKTLLFSRDELEMHHMTYVRKDFDSFQNKTMNSSARVNYSSHNIKLVLDRYKNWKYPMKGLTIGMVLSECDIVEVDNSWIK